MKISASGGQITYDAGLSEKVMSACVLFGRVEFEGDEPVLTLLADYHFHLATPPVGDGYAVYAVSRPVVDRAKYPNWPQPEPAI